MKKIRIWPKLEPILDLLEIFGRSKKITEPALGYKKLSGINERYSFEDPNSIFLLKCKHLKWLKPIASIPYPSKMLMELGTAFFLLELLLSLMFRHKLLR